MTDEDEEKLSQTLEQLHDILKATPHLESISIIENPEPLTLESLHLGISRKAFKTLGLFASKKFARISKVENYFSKDSPLDGLSAVLTVLNPDDSKHWNFRKKLFRHHYINNKKRLSAELLLTACSLKLKPKSAEPFNHCRWLLANNGGVVDEQTISSQLKVCEHSAGSYKQNYYSWNYRFWLIKSFPRFIVLKEELGWSRLWVESHISQFCGMNYRFNLLLLILQNPNPVLTESYNFKKENTRIFISEFSFVCDLVLFYPETESLWSYLRLLLLYCDANEIDYVKSCSKRLANVDKIKNRFAVRFKENIIAENLF